MAKQNAAHFNGLTPAELERLAILSEELGEAQQAVGKILRHGYELQLDQWRQFLEALDRPGAANPHLRRLLTEPSVIEGPNANQESKHRRGRKKGARDE